MTNALQVLRTGGREPAARRLLGAIEAEFEPEFGPPLPGHPATVAPQELGPPGGVYVALLAGEEPVAGGGVRRLAGDLGEVKRMYVAPAERGRGLARVLLGELEAAARDLGCRRLRLDTRGSLERFYVAEGYAPVPAYNANPYATFWGEEAL